MATLKQIPAVVSNVNRYLRRKTLPKNIDDFWITRISGNKLDKTWKVVDDWDKDNYQSIFNDIESGHYSVVDFATYVALHRINTDEIFTGKYSQDYHKKVKNISAMFDKSVYVYGVRKVQSILESSGLKQDDFMKINTNGSSLLYELFMAGEIDLAVAIQLEPFTKGSKQESSEHIEFRRWLKILHAIRKGK